jgi:radical SAM protein with 4Fe4S-binding SPASM domain
MHCYNYWRDFGVQQYCSASNQMTEQLAEKVAQELIDAKVFSVCLTGGEPLLNYGVIKLLLQRWHGTSIRVSMNSNATLLTRSVLDELTGLGLASMYFSIHGASSDVHDSVTGVTGSFDKTVAGIELCLQNGVSFSTNTVVSKLNKNELLKTAKMLRDMGCTFINMDVAECPVNCADFSAYSLTRKEYIDVLNQMSYINNELGINVIKATPVPYCIFPELDSFKFCLSTSCSAGILGCTIASDGEVRACPFVTDSVGSIQSLKLADIWQEFSAWQTDEFILDECHECWLLERCGGSCKLGCCNKKSATKLLINPPNASRAGKMMQQLQEETMAQLKTEGQRIIINDFAIRSEEFGAIAWNGYRAYLINKLGADMLGNLQPNMICSVAEIVEPGYEKFFSELIMTGFVSILNP